MNSLQDVAILSSNIATCYFELGELNKAWNEFEGALKIELQIGDRHSQTHTLIGQGDILALKGRHKTAIKRYSKALDIALRLGSNRTVAESHLKIAEMYLKIGKTANAKESSAAGIAISRTWSFDTLTGKGFMVNGKILREEQDWLSSIIEFEKSLNFLEKVEAPDLLAECYFEFGQLWEELKQEELKWKYMHLAARSLEKATPFFRVEELKKKIAR